MYEEYGKNSILIVDDDPLILAALEGLLGIEYVIFAAKNGVTAVELAKKHLPDLIILDIIMEDLDGHEVLAKIRSMEETKETPVIFLSGLSEEADEKIGLGLGVADYIKKPFDSDIVKLRVKNQMRIINALRKIEDLSNTDQLTGIPNRRNFSSRFDNEWNRATRDGTFLSLLMVDIDKFKNYNDNFGHLQGDIALKVTAKAIAETVKRTIDVAARWGGEEFAVLLPATDLDGAMLIGEKIRVNVENSIISCDEENGQRITVSVGVNTIKPNKDSKRKDFISKVDEALYDAKRKGRNRVSTLANG